MPPSIAVALAIGVGSNKVSESILQFSLHLISAGFHEPACRGWRVDNPRG